MDAVGSITVYWPYKSDYVSCESLHHGNLLKEFKFWVDIYERFYGKYNAVIDSLRCKKFGSVLLDDLVGRVPSQLAEC